MNVVHACHKNAGSFSVTSLMSRPKLAAESKPFMVLFFFFLAIPPKKKKRTIKGYDSAGILDTSAPGQIGTYVRHFGTKTNRQPDNSAPQKDKSALVFFFL